MQKVMGASTINAEVFQQLSYIADDENAMEKVLKAIKKIVARCLSRTSGL